MFLKRRLENQYRQFIFSFKSISLPNWLDGRLFKITLSSFVVLFGILYLFQTNNTAASGYEINRLEKQIDGLSSEIQKNEIAIAQEGSMVNIQTRLSVADMIPASDIKFIDLSAGSVALR